MRAMRRTYFELSMPQSLKASLR